MCRFSKLLLLFFFCSWWQWSTDEAGLLLLYLSLRCCRIKNVVGHADAPLTLSIFIFIFLIRHFSLDSLLSDRIPSAHDETGAVSFRHHANWLHHHISPISPQPKALPPFVCFFLSPSSPYIRSSLIETRLFSRLFSTIFGPRASIWGL